MSPSVSVRLLLTQSDTRLVAFAHAGHERAFEALVQRYRRLLLGYCRRLLLSDEGAEDALQQALLQAWLALRSGTEVGEVKPWLFRIVHNAALNMLRASGYDYCKLSESLSGANAPQEDLDRRIAVREALAGLAALPEMQREALLRTAVEGRSHQQVARDLGLSENALRGLVYRARATLRAAAGAVVPSPLVSWALGSGGRGAPVVERLAELGVGGGSAGIAGLLMKGGAVALTASVLAGGIATVHTHTKRAHPHARQRMTSGVAHPAAAPLGLAATRSVNIASVLTRHAPTGNQASPASPALQPSPRLRRGRRQATTMPFVTSIVSQPGSTPSKGNGRDRGGHRHDDGDSHEARGRGGDGPESATTDASGGDASHTVEHTQPGSSEGSNTHDGRDGGMSRESASHEGASGDARGAGGSEDNDSSKETSQQRESREHQSSPEGNSTASSSSKEGQSSPSEGTKED
jgi:RNA polymerase sigma factor (sigma-70 family)